MTVAGDGLASRDWRQRLAALRSSETAETFGRNTLLRFLDDPAADVRRRACDLLGRIGDHDVARALIGKAADPDKNVRNEVAKILGGWADESEAVRRLLADAFNAQEMRLRFLAARCWGGRDRVEPLVAAIDDPAANVRWAATRALAWHVATRPGDRLPAAVEALRTACRDPAPTVREEAFRGFWTVNEKALDLDEALPQIVAGLDDAYERVRSAAALALRDRGDPRVVAPLESALRDRSAWVRQWAVEGIAKADAEAGYEVAVVALRDRNRNVRVSAARTLGGLRDRRAVEPLVGLLTRSARIAPRVAAADALGEIRDKRAVPPLIDALLDSAFDRSFVSVWGPYPVRHAAAKALRRIRTRAAMEAVRSASL